MGRQGRAYSGIALVFSLLWLMGAESTQSPQTSTDGEVTPARSGSVAPDVRDAVRRIDAARHAMHRLPAPVERIVGESRRVEGALRMFEESDSAGARERAKRELAERIGRLRALTESASAALVQRDGTVEPNRLREQLERLERAAVAGDAGVAGQVLREVETGKLRRRQHDLARVDTIQVVPAVPALEAGGAVNEGGSAR